MKKEIKRNKTTHRMGLPGNETRLGSFVKSTEMCEFEWEGDGNIWMYKNGYKQVRNRKY